MSKEREALKLALKTLEKLTGPADLEHPYDALDLGDVAVVAIKEALAQPEQEPLEYWNAVEGWVKIDEVRQHFETVSCGTIYKTAGEGRVPLYTTPPKRQPLTDEQIIAVAKSTKSAEPGAEGYILPITFAREIEAAHGIKEKNHESTTNG
jgi:hypothetical protein